MKKKTMMNDKDPKVFKVLAKRLDGKLFSDKGYILSLIHI